MDEQNEQLERVLSGIGEAVLDFCNERKLGEKYFYATELRKAVEEAAGPVAPNSPYRILYELKRQGKVNYRVVSRSKSLYELLEV